MTFGDAILHLVKRCMFSHKNIKSNQCLFQAAICITHTLGMCYTQRWRETEREWSVKGGNQERSQVGTEKKTQGTFGLRVPHEAYLLGAGI